MNKQRAPNLRVDFARDGRSVKLTDADGGESTIPCRLTDTEASEYRKFLKRSLDQVKDLVRGQNLTLENASQALGKLNERGLTLVWQIFGESSEQVVNIFQKSFPAWRAEGAPAVMSVTAELSRFIPIEFLPLFELSEWPIVDDLATLEAAARRFPGFSVIVRREFPNTSISQDIVIKNEPKLPLKCFVNRSLRGSETEVNFFKSNESYIDIDGPWPMSKLSSSEFSKSIASYLRYADERFDGQPRAPIDQIQHFICHCEIDEDVSSDSILRFSDGNEVTISALEAKFAIPSSKNKPQFGPLIFLNACGTSRVDPMAVTSFPRFFLEENRNRGFIGTETNVPDSFAAEFSRRFYRGLLKGLSLGRAIHDAKWGMLRDRMSPLGILYTVYADPDLHVSKPVNDVDW